MGLMKTSFQGAKETKLLEIKVAGPSAFDATK
jgi:hypothetical protein